MHNFETRLSTSWWSEVAWSRIRWGGDCAPSEFWEETCFSDSKNGICLTAFRHVPEKLLRPPAVLEVSESFRAPIWRINLGGLFTWISLLKHGFWSVFQFHPCYLERERCVHLMCGYWMISFSPKFSQWCLFVLTHMYHHCSILTSTLAPPWSLKNTEISQPAGNRITVKTACYYEHVSSL